MNVRSCWIAAALMLGGCVNQDLRFYEVELEGTVVSVDPQLDGLGEVHLELHHERVGQGMFERPLGLVDAWTLPIGEREFAATSLVSQDDGAAGLVVYGWLDLDGDGVLCSIDGDRSEPAGIVNLDEYPSHAIRFTLELSEPCKGPEALFP
jgi:hypothetical protein